MTQSVKKNSVILISSLFILLISCSTRDNKPVMINKFNDPTIKQINEQRYNYWRSHLRNSLDNPNPLYKVEAIYSFASLLDNTAYKDVESLLKDSSPEVRSAAAFYISKINGAKAYKAIASALTSEQNPETKKRMLIALAKTITPLQLPSFLDVSLENSTVKEGYFLGLIDLKKRSFKHPKFGESATSHIVDKKEPQEVRVLASYLLSICDSAEVVPHENSIKQALTNESSAEVASYLVLSLTKINNANNGKFFKEKIKSKEELVRMSSLYGLYNINSIERGPVFVDALEDSSINVRTTAAYILNREVDNSDAFNFLSEARKQKNWEVKLNLFEKAYRLSHDPKIIDELINHYSSSENSFEKSECVRIIGLSQSHYKFIKKELFETGDPIIRTSCAWALVTVNMSKDFPKELSDEFIEIYKQGLQLEDPALAIIFCQPLQFRYSKKIPDAQFLKNALTLFKKQHDFRTVEALEGVIAKIEKRTPQIFTPETKMPDWDLIATIKKDQKVLIKTTKGDITIRLLVENAPVAVSNFFQLVKDNYYNDTFLFETNSNSIIRGGCKRGDGYGWKGYFLPYETNREVIYSPTLNVSNIGNYFESTQWYISLNPIQTRLDHLVTIGVIETGTSVLRKIERGDKIITISTL